MRSYFVIFKTNINMYLMSFNNKPRKGLMILIHTLIWIIVFVSPFLFIPWEFADRWLDFYWRFLLSQVMSLMIFYFNFAFLIDKFLFNKKLKEFLLWNIVSIIVSLFIVFLFDKVLFPFSPDEAMPHRAKFGWLFGLMRDLILYILTAGLSVAIKVTAGWYKSDSQRKELEKIHAEAELKNLKRLACNKPNLESNML